MAELAKHKAEKEIGESFSHLREAADSVIEKKIKLPISKIDNEYM